MRTLITRLFAMSMVAFLLLTSIPVQSDIDSYAESSAIPSSYNLDTDPEWNYGELFPVRNQGNIGDCWAHGASEAIESALYVKYGDSDRRISPLAMAYTYLDCDGEDESYKYNDILANLTDNEYINSGGIVTESIFGLYSGKQLIVPEYCAPYYDGYIDYDFTSLKSENADDYVVIKEIECYNLQSDRDTIKQRIMDGYIGSFVYFAENYSLTDNTMVESDYYYDYEGTDHVVALVGWDDDYSKEKFGNCPANDGAWRIRNSWGADNWDGYCWVSYESVASCVYFVTELEYHISDGRISNVYSYDMGYSNESDILCNGSISMSNVFTAEGDERLDGVSFSAFSQSYNTLGEEYTITVYKLNEDYSSPVDGKAIASATGKVNAQGIVYEEFSNTVMLSEGDVFSAVIELSNPTGNVVIPIDTEELISERHYYTAANPGESYINTDGEWIDLSSDNMTNVRIKAYTSAEIDGNVSSSDGSRYYSTIEEAIDDGTYDIKLYADAQLNSQIVSDNDISLDLNGYRLTSTVSGYSFDMPQNDLLIRNGYLGSSDDGINARYVTIINAELECSDIAVNAESADIEISSIAEGNVTLTGTDGSKSDLCCTCSGNISIINNELIIIAGDFIDMYLSGGTAVINKGNFNNNLNYDDTVELSIFGGTKFKADSRDEIESKIDQSIKDAGYRAIGTQRSGWNVMMPIFYYEGKPYVNLTSAMKLSNATITLASDGSSDADITGNITIDLAGHTLESAGITIEQGATLTLYNGNVTLSGRLTVENGGNLIIGSDDSATTVDCGQYMIDAKKGSSVTVVGSESALYLEFTDLKSKYSLNGGSFSYAGSKTVQIYEGRAEDLETSERTDFTAVRTSWQQDGYQYYSLVTIPGSGIDFSNISYEKDNFSYDSYSKGGIFILNVKDTLNNGKYSIGNSAEDGENKIDAWIMGLRFVDTIPDSIVDSICEYADEMIDNNDRLPYEFTLKCYVRNYSWHDSSEPYKILSEYAINELKERNCHLVFEFLDSLVRADLTPDFESEDYYAISDRAQNADLTKEQQATIGCNKTYHITCSSDAALENGVTIEFKGYRDSLLLYRIEFDGSFSTVDFTNDDGNFVFTTDKDGIFTVAENKGAVTGTGPVPIKGLMSNGNQQELISPASDVKGGYAQYSLDGTNWSTDTPTASDAGKYTVYYRFVTSELGYLNSDVGSVEVSVAESPVSHESEQQTVTVTVMILTSLTVLLAMIAIIRRDP